MSKKIDIVSVFLDDYVRKMTVREIARRTSLNPQTVLNYLLLNKDFFKFKIVGRNHEYHLNFDNPKTIMLVEIAEKQKAIDSLENKELITLINDLSGLYETMILFGSFAKKEQNKESDIDLIFIGKTKDVKIKITNFPREINYEILTFDEFKKKNNAPLFIEIKKNHVIFGETSKIVELFKNY